MKKSIRYVINCVIVILLVCIGICGFGFILRPYDTDICVSSIKSFRKMPENSLDVIVFGSSRAWKGVNTQAMFEEYGIECYNYACNWQHLNTTKLFVQDAFTVQSPKVVCIETYKIDKILRNKKLIGEIYYTRSIPESSVKREYLDQSMGTDLKRRISYYIPLVVFHSNWDAFSFKAFSLDNRGIDFESTRGFCTSDKSRNVVIFNQDEAKSEILSDECVEVLDDIVSFCKANGAQVLFFSIPGAYEDPYENFMSNYAEQNDCIYINLSRHISEIGLDGKCDFSDSNHLNTSGATKVAGFLGQYMTENKLLEE